MAVEIKQALEREFEVILTAQELRSLTFGRLQELTDSGGKCDKSASLIQETPTNTGDIQKNMLLRSLGNEQNLLLTLIFHYLSLHFIEIHYISILFITFII